MKEENKIRNCVEVSVEYRTSRVCNKIKCMCSVKVPEYVYYTQNTMYFMGNEKIMMLKVVSDNTIECISKRKNVLLFCSEAPVVAVEIANDNLCGIPIGVNIRTYDTGNVWGYRQYEIKYIDNLKVSDSTDEILRAIAVMRY